jgi:hypothetical protein
LATSSAHDTPITETLTFNLTGFVDISGTHLPPPDTDIIVHYDSTIAYDKDTTDLSVSYLTGVTVSSPLGFTYPTVRVPSGSRMLHRFQTGKAVCKQEAT